MKRLQDEGGIVHMNVRDREMIEIFTKGDLAEQRKIESSSRGEYEDSDSEKDHVE